MYLSEKEEKSRKLIFDLMKTMYHEKSVEQKNSVDPHLDLAED